MNNKQALLIALLSLGMHHMHAMEGDNSEWCLVQAGSAITARDGRTGAIGTFVDEVAQRQGTDEKVLLAGRLPVRVPAAVVSAIRERGFNALLQGSQPQAPASDVNSPCQRRVGALFGAAEWGTTLTMAIVGAKLLRKLVPALQHESANCETAMALSLLWPASKVASSCAKVILRKLGMPKAIGPQVDIGRNVGFGAAMGLTALGLMLRK